MSGTATGGTGVNVQVLTTAITRFQNYLTALDERITKLEQKVASQGGSTPPNGGGQGGA